MTAMIDKNKYILDAISDERWSDIEGRIGRAVPDPLNQLLRKIGFLQNAIGGDWPRNDDEFIEMQEFIPLDQIAFMGDGAGNYYTVSNAGELCFWDHEVNSVTRDVNSFDSFVDEYLLEPSDLNEMAWHVQMSFKSKNDKELLDNLSQYMTMEPVGEWEFIDTSSAGVSTFEVVMKTDGGDCVISKQTHSSWDMQSYYINRAISVADIEKNKLLFHALSGDKNLTFKLIDYGIMPKDIDDDI